MTSGPRVDAAPHRRRRVLARLCAAALAGGVPLARAQPTHAAPAAQAAQAAPAAATGPARFELEALMALLAERKSGEARFTEERTVTGFDSPLRSSGTLSFTAPDRFARRTLEPLRESMEVAGNQIRLERGGRVRQLALDAVPELTALVEGLRGTLTGNAALLRRHFEARVAGQPGLWTLTLLPRESALAAQVPQLQIVGVRGELRSVELQMPGQQRSLMLIEPVR